jgi:hypothetical protein
MKTKVLFAALAAFILLAGGAWAQKAGPDEEMFREVKLLVFDEKWAEALDRIEEFLARHPQSPYAGQAVFYKAKSLEGLEGREKDALLAYKAYLRRDDRNRNLTEDANVSIVNLALKLWDRGDRSFLSDVEDRLESPNKVVRYYAAVQLSYLKDKKVAGMGLPVLRRVLAEETSSELRDRAKLALLRVAPEELGRFEERPVERKVRMLHFRIHDPRTGTDILSLNLPIALADLVLAGISESDRELLRSRGYDFDRIMREVQAAKGTILEIADPKEGKIIKIWID